MRAKEECSWCMSTQHIERKIGDGMPEEFKFRCSACHEMWAEIHIECDDCFRIVNRDEEEVFYEGPEIICKNCKNRA